MESGEATSGGSSAGNLRKVTMRPLIHGSSLDPASAAFLQANTAAEDVSLVMLTVHNSFDPLEDGLNPLSRVPRFACKAIYYNLYINEMFFRINPCCYMQAVPGFDEVWFDDSVPFMEAWNSEAFVELRARLHDGPLFAACRRCPEKW